LIPRAATRGLFTLLEAGLDILIRDYGAGDSAAVVDLIRQLQAHERGLYGRMKPPGEMGPWYIEKLLEACAAHRGRLLVAEEDGRILGYACVLTALSSETELDEVAYRYASIEDLVVACDHRRRGLGSRLLKACEDIARAEGAPWLRISVLADNATAIRAYGKFGFKDLFLQMEKGLS
jgi:ribosomal protein S18 acetylase RimI-like enzyme